MRALTRGLVVALTLVLASCGETPAPVSEDVPLDIVKTERVRLFPDAALVRLFVESGRYDADGRPILISKEGRVLTYAQRREVEASVSIFTYNVESAGPACFIPHHFFHYYNKAGRQVGLAEVCFCCAQVRIDPRHKMGEFSRYNLDHVRLKKMVEAMGLPTDIECD